MIKKNSYILDDKGTALMEFVLIMPIFCFTIFCIIQLSLVCMAKQLTHYAAYSAARAAIVYNPAEYSDGGKFYSNKGVVHRAACTALSWLGQMPGGPNRLNVPGWGEVPGSGYISQQVFIDPNRSEIFTDVPAVKVTVVFRYPLHIPFAGSIIGYFNAGGKADGAWDLGGLLPTDMSDTMKDSMLGKTPSFLMSESCIIPMQWDNNMFPRAEKTPYLGTEGL